MMKLSTKTMYAVRAMIDLTKVAKGQPERLTKIAERQGIPLPFLEQIFSKLKNANLVSAVRGPQGGYTLSKEPSKITLAHLVTVLEGPMEPVLCTHPENKSETCHDVEGCTSRRLCNELDGAVLKVLHKNTLETMSSEMDMKDLSTKLNFVS